MPSRRALLVTGGCLAAPLTGCVDRFVDDASLREVTVDIYNSDEDARTFHVALETDDGMLEWESRAVDAETSETVVIDPPADASPVALHGAVADFADDVEIIGVNDVDGEYCLHLDFIYKSSVRKKSSRMFSADIRCR